MNTDEEMYRALCECLNNSDWFKFGFIIGRVHRGMKKKGFSMDDITRTMEKFVNVILQGSEQAEQIACDIRKGLGEKYD